MSGYETLKSIDIDKLIRLGFMKQTVKRNMAIYETYIDYLRKGVRNTDAAVFTSMDCNCSDRHVWAVVKRFGENGELRRERIPGYDL